MARKLSPDRPTQLVGSFLNTSQSQSVTREFGANYSGLFDSFVEKMANWLFFGTKVWVECCALSVVHLFCYFCSQLHDVCRHLKVSLIVKIDFQSVTYNCDACDWFGKRCEIRREFEANYWVFLVRFPWMTFTCLSDWHYDFTNILIFWKCDFIYFPRFHRKLFIY